MKKIYIVSLIAGITLILAGVMSVNANPTYFAVHTPTVSATTSAEYMTSSSADTTLSIYATGGTHKIDSTLVLFQVTASTTENSRIVAEVQHSLDGVDWYSETAATSTPSVGNMNEQKHTFVIATSSDQIVYGTSNYRVHKSFYVETPTPYNRVLFSVPSGDSPIQIWADYQPIKEI